MGNMEYFVHALLLMNAGLLIILVNVLSFMKMILLRV